MSKVKKLYKSEDNKIISGVIGGVGEYFNIDPTILRLAWIIFVIITGIFPGIVAYIIAAIIMPSKEHHKAPEKGDKEEK